ncbi:MAG: hypothetical protein QG657_2409, partial [Acidobacteriota bacterium]|nr:hypothetical protein [Acidobacteriota bacterium]
MVGDTPGLITGILAILKSGNCFVPINPEFPCERARFIVNDCHIDVVLTDKENYEKVLHIVEKCPSVQLVLCIDDIPGMEGKAVEGDVSVSGAELVYIIYTSGSTGRPKGVPITHQNLTFLMYYSRDYLGLGIHSRVMQNLSYTFDFGVFEILTTFLFGGRFFILNKSFKSDFSYYPYFIDCRQINTLHTTPVFLNNLADPGKKMLSLKLIHLGGEQLKREVVKNALKVTSDGCRFYNGYGPTEATINCTYFFLDTKKIEDNASQNISIGRPCDRHEIYILDKHFNLQPIGMAGELCIAGPGLSRGYLNRVELTKQTFLEVQKPFFKKVSGPRRERIYRTGDSARWLRDGNIEFIGRLDQQVKVRGFRIELGEIENNLARHPLVKEVVVIAHQHENGSNYLCAYIVTHGKESFTVSQLREYLAKVLPDYMIPAYFIHMERIPFTGTGKVNHRALPMPDDTFIDTGVEYAAPVTGTEKKLTSIWQQLLRLEKIGINDDFFQVGGDSILVNRCIARIREEMHAEIPLRKFFERPFI